MWSDRCALSFFHPQCVPRRVNYGTNVGASSANPTAFTAAHLVWATRTAEKIAGGIVAMRRALDHVSRHLPQEEHEQKQYAQTMLLETSGPEGGAASAPPSTR